ncbi:hypothetical protein PIB30_020519 [Stylosanthes scabra]|uniref:Uncharacterized protein n=1 Tax=Stylosanthes scabra TaxID=79078 RepID=A0ABU6Y8U2_9FABA|nr:hypothetical protein [Stylosanthes scabra]
MAKNSLTYSIAILMISLFISISCSSSAITNKFHETILEYSYWATSTYDAAFSIYGCADNCKMNHAHDATKRKECIHECIRIECNDRHPKDKEKWDSCFALFDGILVK